MRFLPLVLTLCIGSIVLVAADSPFLGTWKLNTAKSKSTPGTGMKEETVKFEKDGQNIKRIATGIDSDGSPVNQTATFHGTGKNTKLTRRAVLLSRSQ
jgi:hypothetical protein